RWGRPWERRPSKSARRRIVDSDHLLAGEEHDLVRERNSAAASPGTTIWRIRVRHTNNNLVDANGVRVGAVVEEDGGAVAARGSAVIEAFASLQGIALGVSLPAPDLEVAERDVDVDRHAGGVPGDVRGCSRDNLACPFGSY